MDDSQFRENAAKGEMIAETKKAVIAERARRQAKRLVDAEDAPSRAPLAVLSVQELFDRPAPAYLIDGWIPAGSFSQVVAPPGTLKTFLALHAALAIASGKTDFFGYTIATHGPVLYIAAEGAGSFQFRIRVWCDEHNVKPLTIPFRIIALPVNLRDITFQAELKAAVEALRPVLIVVDTFSRCTPGADENSAKDVGEAVGFCSELQHTSGAAIMFIHHPPKNDPTGGGRGSGVVFGAVDTELRISTDDNTEEDVQSERLITVMCSKQKDDVRPPPLDLLGCVVPVRDLQGREMAHASGRPITSIVLRLASADDRDREREARETKAVNADYAIDLKILKVMVDYPAATNQKKLREYAGLSLTAVTDSVTRILRARWAVAGKRGEPFSVTDDGRKALETPF